MNKWIGTGMIVIGLLCCKMPVFADTIIALNGDSALADGVEVECFDYTWHCDPTVVHDEVDQAPAEYFTGEKPQTDSPVYIDHCLYYYPQLPAENFVQVDYDGEREWAYYYESGEYDSYIFATLPVFGRSVPTEMMHTAEEAEENSVLHITKPGTYVLEGEWKGQIWVDLGDKDETFADPESKVTVVLDGAQISCTVAPALVFYSAYECDNTWEDTETAAADVDTAEAGVNLVIADGSENYISGTNIYRMLKTKYKNDDDESAVKVQKKMRKIDGALYSYVTMNINGGNEGTGKLTVDSGFEGIDTELHLCVNGGTILVNAQNDGMNVNEDNVSTIMFRGGNMTINAGLGAEGDGVDSNGYILIDGGNVAVNGIKAPDNAFDSEDGMYYQSGTIMIDGVEQSYQVGDIIRESPMMGGNAPDGFGGPGMMGEAGKFPVGINGNSAMVPGADKAGNPGMIPGPGMMDMSGQEDFDLTEFKEKVAALPDDATWEDVLALLMPEKR